MTKSIHSILQGAIHEHLTLPKILATCIIKKVKEQNRRDLAPHQEQIEHAVGAWLASDAPRSDSLSFSIDDGTADSLSSELSLDAAEFEKCFRNYAKTLTDVLPEVTKDAAVAMLKAIKKIANEGELAIRRVTEDNFRERLYRRWHQAFDLLLLEIELSRECAEWNAKRLLTRKRKYPAPLIETTFLLQTRACRVAGEVRVLLEAGYADGAYARWRTLHEIAVTSHFLLNHGDSAAQLYLDHVDIDSWRMAQHFNDAGSKGVSMRALQSLDRRVGKLKAKHGKAFCAEYGWAAVVLKKDKATFADIEKSVGLENVRAAFKLASNTVHAGPKGALYKLGLLDGWAPMLLAGPSNAGLDSAGGYCAWALFQVTANLLHLRLNADTLVWTQALMILAKEVDQAFAKAQRRILKEERTTKGRPGTARQ